MKKKHRTVKLHLCRETVRNLNSPELGQVVGALPTGTCNEPPTEYLCPKDPPHITDGCPTYGGYCTIDCVTWRNC